VSRTASQSHLTPLVRLRRSEWVPALGMTPTLGSEYGVGWGKEQTQWHTINANVARTWGSQLRCTHAVATRSSGGLESHSRPLTPAQLPPRTAQEGASALAPSRRDWTQGMPSILILGRTEVGSTE
jgi:hypothetical protein